MGVKNNVVGAAVATLEAAGINTFFIETDTRTVYVIGLERLLSYLGRTGSMEKNEEAVYNNWHLIEGLPQSRKRD
ncbi:MAG: hypothetical protein CVU90_04575 [Firmicutes bacterium HGW-Firmicutes-15]|nr:MAG: hypothetical protein CVU90_04575 [Firmicutes bacterium HGW-Firmicutes-15]